MSSPTAADLLGYEGRLLSARSIEEIEFLLVNEPFSLLPYEQAFLWRPDVMGRAALAGASGLAEVDANSPFALWFSRAAEFAKGVTADSPVRSLTAADFPVSLNDGAEWIAHFTLVVLLKAPTGEALGGLWFGRSSPFLDEEQALAAWLGQQSEFVLWAWRREQLALRKRIATMAPRRWRALSKGRKIMALGVLAMTLVLPVRLSVLAPAEVAPLKPYPVTASIDGVVSRILIAPNQPVRSGMPLVEMDDTATRNRLLVAQKTLDVARADLVRTAGKAFADDASKSELQLLDSRVRERTAEVA